LGLWTALLAVFASGMLVAGQNYLTRRPLISRKQLGMVVGGGLAAGLVSGVVSQYFFSFGAAMFEELVQKAPVLLKLGQVICWGLLGALLGFGMGFFIPNLARTKAGAAGLIGGVIGAIAFLVAMKLAGELPGRFIGTAVLGFAIGLAVALVERLAREAALIVHWDPNEQTVINLGPEPVVLGSGSDVHLYLPRERGFPDVAALVTFKDGVVQMDNKLSGTVHTLHGGNKLEIGSLIIEIQTDVQNQT
ncbi:MAG: VWA domain-containing protein, partial [Alphaproteobacteria bacterium]